MRDQNAFMNVGSMAETKFSMVYDGPAVAFGTMNVRDLAPALMGLGQLIEESNRVVNGPKVMASVNVRADFKPGSFEVQLALNVADLINQAKDFFTDPYVNAAVNLLALLGIIQFAKKGKDGLLSVLKKLRGKVPEKITDNSDGTFTLEVEHLKITIPMEVLKLYRDIPTRKAAEAIIEPLKNEGINRLEFHSDGEIGEKIEKSETPFFGLPVLPEETLQESKRTAWFSISALAFKEDNKWRLSDGTNTFYVSMEDKDFLKQIDAGRSFSKGDLLHVQLETKQSVDAEGILKTENIATKILEHRSSARQIPLPLITQLIPPDSTHDQ
jgi:hypothetical protein